MKKYLIVSSLLALVIILGFGSQANATALKGWAWSSNVGWISLSSENSGACPVGQVTCATYGVSVSTTTAEPNKGTLGGYAWSSNIGWISFNSGDVSGCPTGVNVATMDLSTGNVTGCGRILSMINQDGNGWLGLSGTNFPTGTFCDPGSNFAGLLSCHNGMTLGIANAVKGILSGFAWESSAVGWVGFNGNVDLGGNVTPPSLSVTCGGSAKSDGTGADYVATASNNTGTVQYKWANGAYSSALNADKYSISGSRGDTITGPALLVKDTVNTDVAPTQACPTVSIPTGGSLVGSCNITGNNIVTAGSTVHYTVSSVQNNVGTVTYTWSPSGGSTSNNGASYDYTFSSPGGPYTIKADLKDTANNTGSVSCGTVTVNNNNHPITISLGLFIASKASTLNSQSFDPNTDTKHASLTVKQGEKFALRWVKTLPAYDVCTPSVSPLVSESWSSGWGNTNDGTISDLSTTNLSLRTYIIKLSCHDTRDEPGIDPPPVSVRLNVVDRNLIEI